MSHNTYQIKKVAYQLLIIICITGWLWWSYSTIKEQLIHDVYIETKEMLDKWLDHREEERQPRPNRNEKIWV